MSKHPHSHAPRDRRAQFASKSTPTVSRAPIAVILGAALLFVGVLVFVGMGGSRGGAIASVPVPAGASAGRDVVLDAAQFDDGQARFFTYASSSGREVRFFVMKSSDGVVRAALDTCDVCYRERKGYRQQGDAMVCNNCGQSFPSDRVNEVQGGCNPAPLERHVVNGQVMVRAAGLEQGAFYF